jgi:ActR/RegA family two-component response regulator
VNIEVFHRGPWQHRIVTIDGVPFTVGQAAKRLGMKYKTLAKRLERRANLETPPKRYCYE